MKKALLGMVVLGLLPMTAMADGHGRGYSRGGDQARVSVSVGFGVGGGYYRDDRSSVRYDYYRRDYYRPVYRVYSPPVVVYDAPVVYAPPPVIYAPPPPPPVVYYPAPRAYYYDSCPPANYSYFSVRYSSGR